jgi:hypothetical protein
MLSRNYINFTANRTALIPRAYCKAQIYSNILPTAWYNCTVTYCLLQDTIVQ